MSNTTAPKKREAPDNQTIFSPLTKLNLFILCLAILAYAAISLTELLPSITAMLAASLILTYLLLGPVQAIEQLLTRAVGTRWKLPAGLQRVLAIVAVYLLGLTIFAITLFRVAAPLSIQIKDFARDIPIKLNKANTPLSPTSHSQDTVYESLRKITQPIPPKQATFRDADRQNAKLRIVTVTSNLITQKLTSIFQNYATKLGRYALDVGTTALSSIVYILTTLVLTFYLLVDGKTLRQGLIGLMPNRHEAFAKQFLSRLHRQFYTIVKGQVLMSFLSGGLMYCALLVMGVKYALLLGIVLGGVSILPVIGPWLGLLPIIAVVEMSGDPVRILPVLLVAGSFYLLKAYWLWPKLVSRKFDLHPILFILSFLICITIIGFPGIFLSFPLTSVVGVWLDFQKARHSKAYLTQNN